MTDTPQTSRLDAYDRVAALTRERKSKEAAREPSYGQALYETFYKFLYEHKGTTIPCWDNLGTYFLRRWNVFVTTWQKGKNPEESFYDELMLGHFSIIERLCVYDIRAFSKITSDEQFFLDKFAIETRREGPATQARWHRKV